MKTTPFCRIAFLAMLISSAACLVPPTARAETFVLKNGGTVVGEVLNPDAVPRNTWEIRTDSGIVLSLAPKDVERRHSDEKDALSEYKSFAPLRPDTVESHRELADWCKENRLAEQMRDHLLRIVELDPDNAEARRRLGHEKIDGIWMTRKEKNLALGYVRYRGGWWTQQEVDLMEQAEKKGETLKNWRNAFKKSRETLLADAGARERFLEIENPEAVPALVEMLNSETHPELRILCIRALSRIGTPGAVREIGRWSMEGQEPVGEVREVCYDEIRKHPEALPLIGRYYAGFLDPRRNGPDVINKAATGMRRIGARTLVPELIDALVTRHDWERTVTNQGNVNAGSGVLNWGVKKETGTDVSENREVLRALIELTGQNFGFNAELWKSWWIRDRKTPTFDLRRG